MITHADAYTILNKLNAFEDGDMVVLPKSDQMQILHQRIDNKIHEAYERNTRSYNKRSRVVSFKPDQEVYRKNFVGSNFKKGINSKFGKPWLKCRVTPSLYLLYIFPWKIRLYHIQKNI